MKIVLDTAVTISRSNSHFGVDAYRVESTLYASFTGSLA